MAPRPTPWSWSTSRGSTDHDFDHLPDRVFPIAPLPAFIDLHERIGGHGRPLDAWSRWRSIRRSIRTMRDAQRIIEQTAAETGLPCDDPVRFGPERLWTAVRERVDALVS